MEVQNDLMIDCQCCGCDAAYKTNITDKIYNIICYGCGMYTNSLMKVGTEFYQQQMEVLPELYKDLAFEHPQTKEVWYPSIINLPDKGMIFANGKSKEDWKWASVKAIDIPKEEQYKYPNPTKKGEFYKRRMDMSTLKEFERNNFIGAMEFLGLFENE